jgi:hypothetical protein
MIPLPLLRSIVRVEEEPEEDLASNLLLFRRALEPEGVEGDIVRYIGRMYDQTLQVPSLPLVRLWFTQREAVGDGAGAAALTILNALAQRHAADPLHFLSGNTFQFALDHYRASLLQDTLSHALVETGTILSTGVQRQVKVGQAWQQITLQGPDHALDFLNDTLNSVHRQIKSGSMEGDFRAESEQVWQTYLKAKANPAGSVGVLSGIEPIDTLQRGLLPGELTLVMGFVGHLKTSFVMNWLYHCAIVQGKHGAVASLEMPVEELRRVIYVMHAANLKWQDHPAFNSISVDHLRYGNLTDAQEELFQLAADDLAHNPSYGAIHYKEPQENLTIPEIERWATMKHRQTPLDLLVIDYLGLVDPGKKVSGLEKGANLNMVIRQAKGMALSFDRGRGIPILSPFQANREGLKLAEKSGGQYHLTALADAHEAERSTDKVYYTYFDATLRAGGQVQVGSIKNRNGAVISVPFRLFADPRTRIITNPDAGGSTDPRQRVLDTGF